MSDKDLTVPQRLLASATGATITAVTMNPFDLIKTRLQAQEKIAQNPNVAQGHLHLKGTWDAFIKIPKHEGLPALWTGLPPTLAMVVPSTVLYFTSYDVIKFKLESSGLATPAYAVLVSGALARTITVIAISPLELIRTKMQSERLSYSQIGKALRDMIRAQGVSALYMGLQSTLLRDVVFSCLYWSSYEFLKRSRYRDERPTLPFCMAAGAVAGSTAAVVTLPFDVVKTHRQMDLGAISTDSARKAKGPMVMMFDIYKKSGVRGLFVGIVPRLARTAPACAIMLSTYETFKTYFVTRMPANQPNSALPQL